MRLIDEKELKEWVENWFEVNRYYHPYSKSNNIPITELYDIFEHMPTIDAEPVIRCKDCNFCGEIDENGWHCCENFGVGMPKNGFCSDAERREDVKAN